MKYLIYFFLMTAGIIVSCNSRKTPANQSGNKIDQEATGSVVSVRELIDPYLQLKNALVRDNSSDAATFGVMLQESFKKFDKTGLSPDQKKIFEDTAVDAVENAEHIGEAGGNIEHQREHFELLSKDIYELVKTLHAGEVLYKDFCPMYNNGKGAFWLSESKDILNPYYGKQMLTCGSIVEELN